MALHHLMALHPLRRMRHKLQAETPSEYTYSHFCVELSRLLCVKIPFGAIVGLEPGTFWSADQCFNRLATKQHILCLLYMEHEEENWVPIRVPITKSMTWVSFVHANDFAFLIERRKGILLFPSILGNVTLIAYRTCTRLKQIVLLVHIVLFNYCALWVKVDLMILYRGIKMTIHSLWEYINILRRFNVVLKRQILVNTKPVCMVPKHTISHEQYLYCFIAFMNLAIYSFPGNSIILKVFFEPPIILLLFWE